MTITDFTHLSTVREKRAAMLSLAMRVNEYVPDHLSMTFRIDNYDPRLDVHPMGSFAESHDLADAFGLVRVEEGSASWYEPTNQVAVYHSWSSPTMKLTHIVFYPVRGEKR